MHWQLPVGLDGVSQNRESRASDGLPPTPGGSVASATPGRGAKLSPCAKITGVILGNGRAPACPFVRRFCPLRWIETDHGAATGAFLYIRFTD